MTQPRKRVLEAIFWFVLGHVSCAILHHMHGPSAAAHNYEHAKMSHKQWSKSAAI